MAWENLSTNWIVDKTWAINGSVTSGKVDFWSSSHYNGGHYGKATIALDVTNISEIRIYQTQRNGHGASDLYFGLYNSSAVGNNSNVATWYIDNTDGTRTLSFNTKDYSGTYYMGFLVYVNTDDPSSSSRIDFSAIQVDRVPSYTVSLTKGAGISSVSGNGTYVSGTEVSISATASTGYNFSKWTGSAETASNPYKFTINGNKSFTANATAITYTVAYNANGGSGAPSSQIKTYGTALTLSTTKPKKNSISAGSYTITLNANGGTSSSTSLSAARTTSYSFSKWNTKLDGSGTSYSSGGSYTTNANVTLYAIYTSTTTTAAVTLPTPTRAGYKFLGWATSATASSGVTGSYTPSKNITLYAIWKSNGTVRIEVNGVSKLAQVFVFNNNAWHLTQPYLQDSNKWKLNGG